MRVLLHNFNMGICIKFLLLLDIFRVEIHFVGVGNCIEHVQRAILRLLTRAWISAHQKLTYLRIVVQSLVSNRVFSQNIWNLC